EEDEILIKSRSIRKEDNPLYYKDRLAELQSTEFANAIYAYSTRAKTNERNSIKLKEIATKLKKPIWMIQSVDKVGMARTSFFNPIKASNKDCKIHLKPPDDENECGSMFEQLPLCVGARVICRRNIDFDGSMVNGTEATVKDIIWDNNDNIILPTSNRCVFPNLDRAIRATLPKYVELELDNGSLYKMVPEEVSFEDKNGIWMTRRQLPLSLGYAITIHRSQCMTYNKLVGELTGINWKSGMFYTILSRTRKLNNIIILAYDRKSLKVSKVALNEMYRLETIEKEYPINIEQYLRTERYIDWCLSLPSEIDKPSSITSKRSAESISEHVNIKQFKLEKLNSFTRKSKRKPQNIIICEQQEEYYCGRHVLEVAEHIAATEQILQHEIAVNVTDYYYENTGDYNIEILKVALRNVFNIEFIQIDVLERNTTSVQSLILSNIHNVQALIIQQNNHYYCLCRFRLTEDYFFKIDSKFSLYHEPIHRENILNFLRALLANHSNIYVLVHYTSDHADDQLSIDNIETRLWPLPDSPADLECLLDLHETQ
ncbi:unnamed protein product, partial [Adineta steineri]